MRTPRRRPGESSQKHGTRFEKFWAGVFGVKPTRGSGNQWFAKLDVADGSILWSCKHTDKPTFTLTKLLMREVEQAINGPGGVGGSTLPGLAISLDEEPFVILRAEDFVRLLQSPAANYIVPSKGAQKRARGKTPALLRDDD